ncbi:hypothetical protein FRC07_010716 [Ceratobasidium sp. 392]|nr:hypothetical protein FRC07_010716 [Ceratobasidium sp. 392]
MSICLDNASNNNTLVRSIAPSLPNFRGAKARGRCVAHIANLVAQAFISPFTQPPSKKQRLAGQSSNTERQSAPGTATNHPPEPTTTCNEPSGEVPDSHKVNLDNTDDGSELPDKPDDGRQAFDHGEVTAAVEKALERVKQDYHVIVSQAELDKACEVIPKWFEDYKYPPRRIQGVREMLHNQFNQFYAHQPSTQVPTPGPSCPTTRSEPQNPWMAVPVISRAAAPEMVTRTALNAIDLYLASPLTVKDKDTGDDGLMAHWTREENLGSPIARMALDILTAPASSVDVERAFSGGRMAVNYRQHRMSLSTFRAKMALGAWYGTPLMPNIEEAVYVMNDGTTDHSEALDL